MSDSTSFAIGRVSSVGEAAPVQPVRGGQSVGNPGDRSTVPHGHDVAAVTGGNLPAAYSSFIVNSDTNDVVVLIHDATTDQVIAEYPSRQVEEMSAFMKHYAETLARRHAAQQASAISGSDH